MENNEWKKMLMKKDSAKMEASETKKGRKPDLKGVVQDKDHNTFAYISLWVNE